jgi:hypothetical protein
MLDKKTLQGPFTPFESPKTVAPIPVRHSAVQDALIQSSLDPRVRSIGYVASAVVAGEQVDLDAIVVQRDDGRFFLNVVPAARRVRDLEEVGLALIALRNLGLRRLTIDAKELLREPRCTNARFVWLYNGYSVPRKLRERILRALSGRKQMQLGELERSVRSRDPSHAVMSLVCADVLELDLTSQAIQLTTVVRAR